ncbi:hypothetical protein LT493_24605 [Streptomyces tricolor]|nr:hypothetical protein [Streptomyces tricolor]
MDRGGLCGKKGGIDEDDVRDLTAVLAERARQAQNGDARVRRARRADRGVHRDPAVDFLGLEEIVDRERIARQAISGLSGMALAAAAADSRNEGGRHGLDVRHVARPRSINSTTALDRDHADVVTNTIAA